jgi:teichuronic acid biosynthesis glycosyltransferase TuaC
MRVLAITKIFPNSLEPLSSPFNRQQFAALAELCDLTVIEAIPWFPLARLTGKPQRAAMLAELPRRETVAGIETVYMRQLYIPMIGTPVALPLYVASLAPYRALVRDHDVVLGTWAYPDGCAATVVARALDKPVVVKVHGSDVNVVAKMPSARAVMKRVLPRVTAIASVSRALSDELVDGIGVAREKIRLVPNGVDTSLFFPRDRAAMRASLGLPADRPLILFVGRLEPQKGVEELLLAFEEVLASRPDAMLALVGAGPLKDRVAALQSKWRDGALHVPGPRPLAEIAEWMGASDLFTLPSWNEGTPNVVLEALASGRPAVGTRVGGIPDVLASPDAGILVPVRDASSLARALLEGLARRWDQAKVLAAGPCSWKESARQLFDVLESARRRDGRG